MAMENLKHFSHECDLTSPEIVRNNICNICYKDEPIEFACESCNFDICKVCSKLPHKVFHDFHHKHPLELCLYQYDRKPEYVICSGCGNMCSGSYYGCEPCEIYLDLGCAVRANIVKGWDVEEMLHDSHAHLLKRCRPGPDAKGSKGSCLLCELPVTPSSICYGCVRCYLFVHHHCLDIPKEIQHPVHSAHSLKRVSYIRTCGELVTCSACTLNIVGFPYSCLDCNIDLHLRCADSLLRGLLHKSHEHRLFYVATDASDLIKKGNPCQICNRTKAISLDCCYHCVECDLKFHFECLEIPEYVVRKSYHIHPLVCKIFRGKDGSLEYCDVCETMVHEGHHAYSCEECDFLGHIECLLRKEEPSPLYLKDLYSCGEDVTGVTDRDDEIKKIGTELIMVNDVIHIHTMRPIHMSELGKRADCNICYDAILGSPYKCTTCSFQAHHFCSQLGHSSRNLVHLHHPLTLLPKPPIGTTMSCDNCRNDIRNFNLFCRICNFIIDIGCTLKYKQSLGVLGQKIIGKWEGSCITSRHSIVEVLVSRSYMTVCAICSEKMYGRALSCMDCGEIYHPQCMEVWKQELFRHPLHSNHTLEIKDTSRYECIACKKSIAKYGYNCYLCRISFHIDCIKSVNISGNIKSHIHYLYNFWMDSFRLTRVCSVCARPCGDSFYGCVECNFNAHVECLGMATYVRNQLHQHSVVHGYASVRKKNCSLCGSECSDQIYSCKYCDDVFHVQCLLSMDDREIATEEQQLRDIYLMYIERDLFDVLQV